MDIITKEGETPALFVNSITFNNGEHYCPVKVDE